MVVSWHYIIIFFLSVSYFHYFYNNNIMTGRHIRCKFQDSKIDWQPRKCPLKIECFLRPQDWWWNLPTARPWVLSCGNLGKALENVSQFLADSPSRSSHILWFPRVRKWRTIDRILSHLKAVEQPSITRMEGRELLCPPPLPDGYFTTAVSRS